MGDDVQLDYEIKYDKNLDHTIKYFRIRHGTYLEEDKLFDYFGRKHFESSRFQFTMNHHRRLCTYAYEKTRMTS